ncbi:EAL domain-containing protein [Reinekea sp.]|uniref:EAL domain-containing protein n=1 Tax=Reinekea sp. TaxID=1970455 RepID=UPI002A827F84|nr:EAL domain-containing protein [Reinekea sp.]
MPAIIVPILFSIVLIFIITAERLAEMQFELLTNNVSYFIDRSNSELNSVKSLGMADVDFFQNAAKRSILIDGFDNLSPGSTILVLDAKTGVLLSPSSDAHGIDIDPGKIQQMVQEQSGQLEYRLSQRTGEISNIMMSYETFQPWDWLVVSLVDDQYLYSYIADALWVSVSVMAIFVLLVLAGVYAQTRGLSRALIALELGTQRLAENNFAEKIVIDGDNEFSRLADNFNYMSREVNSTHAQLRKSIVTAQATSQRLQESEQRQELALNGADLGLWDLNLLSGTLVVDERWCAMLGQLWANWVPHVDSFWSLVHPEDVSDMRAVLAAHINGATPSFEIEYRMLHGRGHWVWIHVRGRAFEYDADGHPQRIAGTNMDVTRRKETEANLQLLAGVFNHAREGILITSLDGTVIDVNGAFTRITGYARKDILGANQRVLRSGQQGLDYFAALRSALFTKGYWHGEIWYRKPEGEVFPVMQTISAVLSDTGEIQHYVALFTDISADIEHKNQLQHLAHYDVLTDLPNRALLSNFLHRTMAQGHRRKQSLAVIYLDLDGFKAINDSYGHNVGDQVLVDVGKAMNKSLRQGDLLARIGGDEFVAVLTDLDDVTNSKLLLDRLQSSVVEHGNMSDWELSVTASMGVTFYPQAQPVDADQLLRQADQAMYQAKVAGRDRYHIFDAELDSAIRNGHDGRERIRVALECNEFVLFYQPKINMRTGQITGAEALIRWQDPERGLLMPSDFLPLIDDHPLAIDLGEWVIESALTQMAVWQEAGLALPVSINIGAEQLQHVDFPERLRMILAKHSPELIARLELEILETSALLDIARVGQVVDECTALGLTFALDDFGTGFSSLIYLRRLNVSVLKIDQSFVRDLLHDQDGLAIVEGVIGLATAFKRDVIAEGVETLAHATKLLSLGCELGQGYGIARPMPADALPGWAENWQADPTWVVLS